MTAAMLLTPVDGHLDHARRQLSIHSVLARRYGGATAIHEDGRSLFIPGPEQAFHCQHGLVASPSGQGWRYEHPLADGFDATEQDVTAVDPVPFGHMPFDGRWEFMRAHMYALLRADEAYVPDDPCDDAEYLARLGIRIAHEPKFLMSGFVAPELRDTDGAPALCLNDPGHTVVRRGESSDLPYIGTSTRHA